MSFLYPLFLLAGASLAIPILVHLFNFRKFKTIAFPDIRFLRTIQQETQKSAKLKHRLILASRLLLLLGLILAFSQPYFSKNGPIRQGGSAAYSFFIDNSYSMSLPHMKGTLLDEARNKVRDVIESADDRARFHILTQDFGDKEHRFLNKREALEKLGTLRPSPYSRKASEILSKQTQLLKTESAGRKVCVYLSDFQQSGFPLNTALNEEIETLMIRLTAQKTENIFIDTVVLETPGLQRNVEAPLRIRLNYQGDEPKESQLTLDVGGQLKSMKSVKLEPGKTTEELMQFTPSTAGNYPIRVYLQDYPMSFDDTFYLSTPVGADKQVLLLNEGTANAYLNAVYKTGTAFRADNFTVQQASTKLLANYALVVLNGTTQLSGEWQSALLKHVEQGGQILVFPPSRGNAGDLNTWLSSALGVQWGPIDTQLVMVANFNKTHPLFRNVFDKIPENISLPQLKKRCSFQMGALNRLQSLMSLSTGEAFLASAQVGNGQIYLCTAAPEASWSDFPTSYWFLPLLHQMAMWQSAQTPAAIALGSRQALRIPNQRLSDRSVYHAYSAGIDIIPEQQAQGNQIQVYFQQGFKQAGWYGLALPGMSDTVFTGLNYNRAESDLRYWALSELENIKGMKQVRWLSDRIDLRHEVNPEQAGMPLWKICLIFALLGLLAEILFIRWKPGGAR